MEKDQLRSDGETSPNNHEIEGLPDVVFGSIVTVQYVDAPPEKARRTIVIGDDQDKQLPHGAQLASPHTPLANALLGHDFTKGNTVSFEVINAAHQHMPISVEVLAIDGQKLAG